MSTGAKARVVGALIVAIACWPIVHFQLVRHFDVNPWKLFGFAMYCTPHDVVVDVVDRSGDAPRRIAPEELPPELRARHARYTRTRSVLGQLAPPDDFADELFAALPEIQRLTIAVRIFSLEPLASEVSHRTRLHAFERPSP